MLVAQAPTPIALVECGSDHATVVLVAHTAAFDHEVVDLDAELGQDQLERNPPRVALPSPSQPNGDHLAEDR